MNITQAPYNLMTMYGTWHLNDLGSYSQCSDLPYADYAVLSLNISHTPLTIFFGACMPSQCTQADYWQVTEHATNWITGIYRSFWDNAPPGDPEGIFHKWTEITIMVRKTDEVLAQRREDTHTGFVTAMALSIPLLLLISVIPTAFHTIYRRKTDSLLTETEE